MELEILLGFLIGHPSARWEKGEENILSNNLELEILLDLLNDWEKRRGKYFN